MNDNKILIIGAGKIGSVVFSLLNSAGYSVKIADSNAASLWFTNQGIVVDATDINALTNLIKDFTVVISAGPFSINKNIIEATVKAGTAHYFDLTEDVESVKFIEKMSVGTSKIFMPQCGLAPGFVSVAAGNFIKTFDSLDTLTIRVGALPKYPTNILKYNLTWSTDGLINEYCNPCDIIQDGKHQLVNGLDGYETFEAAGTQYEAFYTSGGVGSLCKTLDGKIRNLNYKTVRYVGHHQSMKLLLDELDFKSNRDLLKSVFDNTIPATRQDVVFIRVSAIGQKHGKLTEDSYCATIPAQTFNGIDMTAIQVTTANGVCAMVDMVCQGNITGRGIINQEDVSYDDFINNQFGRVYKS